MYTNDFCQGGKIHLQSLCEVTNVAEEKEPRNESSSPEDERLVGCKQNTLLSRQLQDMCSWQMFS